MSHTLKHRLGGAVCAAALLCVAGAAEAQTVNSGVSIGPSTRVSTPLPPAGVPINTQSSAPPLPSNEALVPDMFGAGPYLRDHGIAILLDDTDEFDGIISGPRGGSSNAGQYGFETDVDWERLAGVTGFETHTVIVGRYGIPASRMFGDNLNPSQEIYGAGGNVVAHLVFAYGEETLGNGRVNIAAGRIPLLDDFAASPLYCNFQNNSFCGNPKASSDNFAWSSYPDGNWAIRGRVRPTRSIYVQAGIYFSQSDIYNVHENFRSGFTIDSSYINGEAFPVEIGYEPVFGPDKLPGHYKAGFFYSNNKYPDDYFDVNGSAFAQTGLGRRVDHGATAAYALVDQMVMRNGAGANDGVIIFGGYFHNDANVSTRANQGEIAALDRAFWKARPNDTIGIAFNYLRVSDYLTKTEELQQVLGLPITGTPGSFYDDAPSGVQKSTYDLEVNYQIHIYRGVTLAPDFQYFFRPNAQGNLPDAALIGFKSHVELF